MHRACVGLDLAPSSSCPRVAAGTWGIAVPGYPGVAMPCVPTTSGASPQCHLLSKAPRYRGDRAETPFGTNPTSSPSSLGQGGFTCCPSQSLGAELLQERIQKLLFWPQNQPDDVKRGGGHTAGAMQSGASSLAAGTEGGSAPGITLHPPFKRAR